MFRVREIPDREDPPLSSPVPVVALEHTAHGKKRAGRLAAMTALGLVLGAGGAIGTISLVQAGDDAGVRDFQLQEAANRRAMRGPQAGAYHAPNAYAPARGIWTLPLARSVPNGRLAHPPVVLNPFRSVEPPRQIARRPTTQHGVARLETVSGSGHGARTICVRLCDGFHAPIGNLNAQSDLAAHDALCRAMNPGIPVRVFRVPAGASTIDGAVSADGKTYGSLPVAYGHEKSSDPACRPPIVASGERRVSLLRDITLRPGDSVVLDGKVTTFTGSSQWPYSRRDFVDFRSARELSAGDRRGIDERVGISRVEAQMQALRRKLRTREASLRDETVMSDAIELRGSIDPPTRGPIRVIAGPAFRLLP